MLRIYELRQQDGSLLRYDLSGRRIAETHDIVLPAAFSMYAFVGDFLGRLERAYDQFATS